MKSIKKIALLAFTLLLNVIFRDWDARRERKAQP